MRYRQQKQKAEAQVSLKQKQNPEQESIARKYFQQKKKRRTYDTQKLILKNQQNYLRKLQLDLKNKLQKQNKVLDYTKDVHQRRVQELQNKLKKEQQRRNILQKLRELNNAQKTRMRSRIKQAEHSKLKDKLNATSQVKHILKSVNQLKQRRRHKTLEDNLMRVDQIVQEKQRLKLRVLKFKQGKRRAMSHSFREMLEQQAKKSDRAYQDMQNLKKSIKYYESKVVNSKLKLNSLEEQINQIKQISSKSHQGDYSLRASRISSKPTEIILHKSLNTTQF